MAELNAGTIQTKGKSNHPNNPIKQRIQYECVSKSRPDKDKKEKENPTRETGGQILLFVSERRGLKQQKNNEKATRKGNEEKRTRKLKLTIQGKYSAARNNANFLLNRHEPQRLRRQTRRRFASKSEEERSKGKMNEIERTSWKTNNKRHDRMEGFKSKLALNQLVFVFCCCLRVYYKLQ